jgi:Sulfotransferase domain
MPKPLKVRIQRKTRRIIKTSARLLQGASNDGGSARTVFVFGSQRSGTRLPMDVLDLAPQVMTYKEGNSRAFNRTLLKDNAAVAALLHASRLPIVAFKPICDSHRAAELLDYFPHSKAIWIFRYYKDAVNSSVRKWKHGRNNLKHMAAGNIAAAGWRAGGLRPDKIALVRRLYSEEMSSHAAYALMWYLRNNLIIDLKLHERDDFLLIKYENLVQEPQKHFAQIFNFIECPFEEKYVKGVYGSSVGKEKFPEIPAEIAELCENLYQQLEMIYARHRSVRKISASA